MAWWLLLVGLFGTIGTGALLGAALGLTGLIILQFAANGATELAVTATWNTFTDFTLSGIPLFILLGEVLQESGVSKRIYAALSPMFRKVPGGLLHTNIVVCAVFGSIAGSSMSTAAAVGSIAYPELRRHGYDRQEVAATLAAGGTLGLLIPPSLSLLIYGALTDTSVGKLFIAAVIPGFVLTGMFMAYIYGAAKLGRIPAPSIDPAAQEIPKASLWEVWPIAVLLVAVLGSIVMGMATATESAGLGVIAAVALGFFAGDLDMKALWRSLINSAVIYGALGFVILGAVVLAQSVSVLGLPRSLVESVSAAGLSKYTLFGAVVIVYLILGCFFEGLSMMVMTLPLVFPLMMAAGFDPVWFGVIVTILIEVAVVTPPVGLNLFVITAITNGEVTLPQAARACVPYWIVMMALIAWMAAMPSMALWLPNVLMK
jgi:tripartite ATP-independent transporter DctM subunit